MRSKTLLLFAVVGAFAQAACGYELQTQSKITFAAFKKSVL
jgi:outer membrane lipopolysaccharide assembly protein LptE/RlpB